jgi:hypothetical protein
MESLLLMELLPPLHLQFEQSVSYIQLIVRIARRVCACVGLFIMVATSADPMPRHS